MLYPFIEEDGTFTEMAVPSGEKVIKKEDLRAKKIDSALVVHSIYVKKRFMFRVEKPKRFAILDVYVDEAFLRSSNLREVRIETHVRQFASWLFTYARREEA